MWGLCSGEFQTDVGLVHFLVRIVGGVVAGPEQNREGSLRYSLRVTRRQPVRKCLDEPDSYSALGIGFE
jgi:hypothetical protein